LVEQIGKPLDQDWPRFAELARLRKNEYRKGCKDDKCNQQRDRNGQNPVDLMFNLKANKRMEYNRDDDRENQGYNNVLDKIQDDCQQHQPD
jgi:hypothetical protein